MTALPLFTTIDGTNYPLASCRWIKFDANECAMGSHYGDAFTSTEAAAAHFTPGRRDRQREARRGIRYRLVSPDQWQQLKPCLLGECAHQTAA